MAGQPIEKPDSESVSLIGQPDLYSWSKSWTDKSHDKLGDQQNFCCI